MEKGCLAWLITTKTAVRLSGPLPLMIKERLTVYVGRPDYLRKFHGWASVIWFVLSFPLAWYFGSSVIFVTFLSLYAIVTGHWSSWQAARVEVKQDLQDPETETEHYK